MKTEQEIKEQRNKIYENEASEYPGMTYEQGKAEALDWVAGHMSDEDFE